MIVNLLVAALVGVFVGWIASLIMRTDEQQGPLLDLIVGVIGALLGSWIFGNYFGIESANYAGSLSLMGIFWALTGALIFIFILRGLRAIR